MPVKITIHAYERALKRFKWGKRFVNKTATIAFDQGIDNNSAKGKLRVYIKEREEKHKQKVSVKVMGGAVFIFQENVLLTVFELPQQFKRYCDYAKQKSIICPEMQS